ncbi:hypothetical protein L873DRAFT_1802026 [Choiromyces venosus 120613-1]|uniref:Putative lipoate-protein ligase A n=1 Tax=Choiromyces venosus 120613-1 TaxID=1336337 RepID=A0A3N4JW64_9PEZI|nr:hypothetical protein L873DRAFT_1802026 [Choiromyces venosus 120613-1]
MSPSRGLPFARTLLSHQQFFRYQSTSTFQPLSRSRIPVQVYISKSRNPYLNLSLEHHLFQSTPPETTTLLIYTNSPSIILGRNQNPWVEVNHPAIPSAFSPPLIVRRRSGGGTVFHDLGNVNYSVAMPTSAFCRDKHAEMVVRALRRLGVARAVVNKRHDIVLLPDGMEEVGETRLNREVAGTRKVSGSAYKLTTRRSYHHGTMLLESRLEDVRGYLRSAAREWMKARGVDSVRSMVGNVQLEEGKFVSAVVEEFGRMYVGQEGVEVLKDTMASGMDGMDEAAGVGICWVGEEAGEIEEVQKGIAELTSLEWIYGQTPQFTFSVPAPKANDEPIPPLPQSKDLLLRGVTTPPVAQPPKGSELEITANKGIIQSASAPVENLIGKRFDGGIIADELNANGKSPLGKWVESVLGRTPWGEEKKNIDP